MVTTRLSKHEIDDLKASVNFRQFVTAYLGQPKQRHKNYDLYDSPLRNDGQHASFAVYADGYKDYGGAQEHGSVIDFLMHIEKLTFAQAVDRLKQIAGGAARIEPIQRSHDATAESEPPDTIWQNAALKALTQCQAYLWSGRADAQRALAYLRQRGLTDDTIRAAGLGFCPRWMAIGWKNAEGKVAGVWPGIVIPTFYNGALWSLKVRELHRPLKDKYLYVTGSKLRGALFNGDAIQPGAPVVMCEGEFDALLAGQLLAGVVVITPGPVSNTLTKRQLEHISQASAVYLLMDSDDAGQDAAKARAALFDCDKNYLRALSLPAGKDITEYVCEHGGDLAKWFEVATRRVPFPGGVPDSWRSVLLNRAYFPDSYALYMELLNEGIRAGYINPDGFTADDWLTANRELGFDMPPSTARKGLAAFLEIGFFSFVDSDHKTLYTNENKSVINTGAPVKTYCVVSSEAMRRAALAWIEPRLYEQAHPADETLAEPTVAMMRDTGVTPTSAQAIASELTDVLKPAYSLQGNTQIKAKQRARRGLERIVESLRATHSTPLPAGWPLNNAKAYRRAFTHAVAGGGQRSRRELCALLGVSNTALSNVLKDAGIEQVAQFVQVEITAKPEQLEHELNRIGRYELDSPGVPSSLIARLPNGKVINRAIVRSTEGTIDADSVYFYADVQRQGAKVDARYQVASHQKIVRTEPPESVWTDEKPIANDSTKRAKVKTDQGESVKPPRKRHYGPTYDPVWLAGQYWLALKLLGWVQRGDDRLIDPNTGQVVSRDMKPLQLLGCILGISFDDDGHLSESSQSAQAG